MKRFVDFNCPSRLHEILLHTEILDDELLPLGRVFAHEEGEQFVAAGEVMQVHGVEADVFADEVLELAGGDFAEALEARDLVGRAALGDGTTTAAARRRPGSADRMSPASWRRPSPVR